MHQEPSSAGHAPFEYSRIDDRVFIGTNACCQMHFKQELLDQGVSADISLEGEMVDRPIGISTYLWLPTPDHRPPTKENVLTGIEAFSRMLANGQKIYLHCKNGHGRAPTFYAAYLIMKKGLSPDEAVAAIAAKRPSIHLEASQKAFLASLVRG